MIRYRELETTSSRIDDKWQAGKLFLLLLDQELPLVKEKLIRGVFPKFNGLYQNIMAVKNLENDGRIKQVDAILITRANNCEESILSWDALHHIPANYFPELLPLKESLLKWVEAFYWMDYFIMNKALDTMRYWATMQPITKHDWHYGYPAHYMPELRADIEDNDINIHHLAPYEPLIETKNGFLKRAERYADEINARYKKNGYNRTKVKRNLEHYRWLVWHYAGRLAYEQIAQRVMDSDKGGEKEISAEAIQKAIFSTAKMVGLTIPQKN